MKVQRLRGSVGIALRWPRPHVTIRWSRNPLSVDLYNWHLLDVAQVPKDGIHCLVQNRAVALEPFCL